MDQFLLRENSLNDGTQKVYKFDNGYGASVVRHQFSYGGSSGLWELAVVEFDENGDWDLTYNTTVLGYLEWSDVEENLLKIKEITR